MRTLGVTLFAALFGGWTAVAAQCVQATRRPVEDLFLSDVVFPQERHEVQLEMVPSVARVPGGSVSALGAAWEYGLTDAWQIQGAWDGPTRRVGNDSTTTTFSGASVGTKRSFMCLGGSKYDASIGLDVERGGDRSGLKPALIVGRDFGDQAAHLFASAVADIPFTGTVTQSTASVTLGFFARLAKTRVGEWHGSTEVSFIGGASQTSTWLVAPGLLWHSPDAWEFGVGYALATTGRGGRQLSTHVVYEFGGDQ